MTEVRFRWYIRRIFVPFLAWGTTRLPAARVRELLDECFGHRDEEWRRQLWVLVAEKMNRKVPL